jgi:hypothetical protein
MNILEEHTVSIFRAKLCSILKMGKVCPLKTFISTYQTTQYHNLEDNNMNLHCCGSLQSYIPSLKFIMGLVFKTHCLLKNGDFIILVSQRGGSTTTIWCEQQ